MLSYFPPRYQSIMYSSVVKYFKDAEINADGFNKWANTLYVFVAVTCVVIFLKYALRRWKLVRSFPTMQMSFFDILGDLKHFIKCGQVKGISSNVYILQVLSGYNELFKKEKFFYFWLSYSPLLVLTKAETIEEAISGSRNMEKNWMYDWLHPWLGTGLLTSHGGKWKSRRKLLTPSFHFEILKDFLPIFNEQSQLLVQLLKKETKKPWIDIIPKITLCSLDIVCETTLGVSVDAQKNNESEYVQAVLRTAEVFMKRLLYPPYFVDWYFNLSSLGRQFKKDVKLLHNFTRTVISDKKQKLLGGNIENNRKRKALMDLLLDQHVQFKTLTEEDIREEVDTFAFEGHDTTSMGMSWALYLIGLNKNVQENIHEELDRIFGDDVERPIAIEDLKNMEYLERVLKESQRLYPSVPFFSRQLNADITLGGSKIPKGCSLFVFPYALHRDETVFPNPEQFDPDRFLPENSIKRHPYAYIPFSAGPRNCIGQRFAMMEEKVVVANILRNYTLESLDTRDKILPAPELILRSSDPIRIKFKSRSTET